MQVPTAASMKMATFWDIAPRSQKLADVSDMFSAAFIRAP
jgi:hypothetical protein